MAEQFRSIEGSVAIVMTEKEMEALRILVGNGAVGLGYAGNIENGEALHKNNALRFLEMYPFERGEKRFEEWENTLYTLLPTFGFYYEPS